MKKLKTKVHQKIKALPYKKGEKVVVLPSNLLVSPGGKRIDPRPLKGKILKFGKTRVYIELDTKPLFMGEEMRHIAVVKPQYVLSAKGYGKSEDNNRKTDSPKVGAKRKTVSKDTKGTATKRVQSKQLDKTRVTAKAKGDKKVVNAKKPTKKGT